MDDANDGVTEKVISSRMIYAGRAVRLRRDEVLLSSGRRTAREIIEHPGSVAIAAMLRDGRILMIKQFRLAAGAVIWEIPAGTMEKGETPKACARRELEEETGYRPGTIEHLFKSYPAPGYSMELMHFYLATSLRRTRQATEEDEVITVEAVPPENALRMVASGEIIDTKTICALSYLHATGKLR